MTLRYQIVLLAPEPAAATVSEVRGKVRASVERQVDELGLDHTTDLVFLDGSNLGELDPRAPVAAVYFGWGAADASAVAAIERLSAASVFILPVMPTLAGYTSKVPDRLVPINGVEVSEDDPKHTKIACRVLEELRLIRQKRVAFISYKRNESSGVAWQLFDRLAERAYRVFLDVHSVLGGEDFQAKLWDQMNDADILILLRTHSAFTSTWVTNEIARAQNLGLGVLQVLWPGTTSLPGAKLAEPVLLETTDFEPPGPDAANGRLTPAALERLVNAVEGSRARSLAARRTRVVTEFQRAAEARGYYVRIQPVGRVEAESGSRLVTVFPIVGHPDSTVIHEAAGASDPSAAGTPANRAILFDSSGIWPPRTRHLAWLNLHLPVQAIAISEVERLL